MQSDDDESVSDTDEQVTPIMTERESSKNRTNINQTIESSLQRANNLNSKVFDCSSNALVFSPMSMVSQTKVTNNNKASFVLSNI